MEVEGEEVDTLLFEQVGFKLVLPFPEVKRKISFYLNKWDLNRNRGNPRPKALFLLFEQVEFKHEKRFYLSCIS